MKRLTEIGIECGTDKATYHSFTEFYNDYFNLYSSPTILEIGVYNFASIRMLQKFFESVQIVGMDIDDKSKFLNDTWVFIRGNQTNVADLQRCVDVYGIYDIIIDDGGHTMKQQQTSLGFLFDKVSEGGLYVMEDIHTSFIKSYIDSDCTTTTYDMLNMIANKSIGFSNYISLEVQHQILQKIKDVKVYAKDPSNLSDSVTSILLF